LFINVPYPSISLIYATIGCQYTLQQASDHLSLPNVPSLTVKGFVRWEAIEILMGPEEHVVFLQNAVRDFTLKHPDTSEPFPTHLPLESFPRLPDPEMERWFKECEEKFKQSSSAGRSMSNLAARDKSNLDIDSKGSGTGSSDDTDLEDNGKQDYELDAKGKRKLSSMEREIESRNKQAYENLSAGAPTDACAPDKEDATNIAAEGTMDEQAQSEKPVAKVMLSSVPPSQLGLKTLNPDALNVCVDIIAVHGLGAIPDITWRERKSGVN
jgi:hypothetical protein